MSPVGEAVNAQVACVTPMMVHHDEHEAIARGIEGANFFGYSLGHYYVFGEHEPGVTDVWQEYNEQRDQLGYSPEAAAQALERGAARRQDRGRRHHGPARRDRHARPDARVPQRYEEAGVDQVIFVQQAGKNRHEHIMESLEIFGKEVLPEFAERDEKQVAAKTKRLEPVVEKVLARKERVARDLDGYTFPALPRKWADDTGSEEMKEWLAKFAEDRALGKSDLELGLNV